VREESVEKYKRFFLEKSTANLLRLKHVREGTAYFMNRDFYFFDQKFTEEFEELFELTNIHLELVLDLNIDEDTYNKEVSRFNFEFGRKIVNRAKSAGIPAREYYIQWQNYQYITDTPMLVEEVTETGEAKYFSPYSGSLYSHILSRYHGFFKNKDKDQPMHIVLLGDSIFDNGSYVQSGQPDVITQLQKHIPKSTLKAVDGSVISSVFSQIQDIPEDATHLVVSVGGNDCLQATSILYESSTSVGESIMKLQSVVEKFQNNYEKMVQLLLKLNLPVTVCTIYEPQYPDPIQQKITLTSLKLFNDIILSTAIKQGIPVIDLRIVCSNPQDFANPIEPSAIGGSKIADCIARVIHQHDFSSWRCSVYS
jgi:lysophospholipase L1-like esterase